MQKGQKHAKMAEKIKENCFFYQNYLIFPKIIVTLPKNFRKSR